MKARQEDGVQERASFKGRWTWADGGCPGPGENSILDKKIYAYEHNEVGEKELK